MYPELMTRTDLKVFMPPIGGLTIYMFGDPAAITDPTKKLAVRVHDECNGPDGRRNRQRVGVPFPPAVLCAVALVARGVDTPSWR